VTASPISDAADALARESCARLLDIYDAEMSALVVAMQSQGLGVRDQLAAGLTTATHISAYSQGKAELMFIGALSRGEDASMVSENARRHFAQHVPELRDRVIQMTAEGLGRQGR
jgi:hypothetical protein